MQDYAEQLEFIRDHIANSGFFAVITWCLNSPVVRFSQSTQIFQDVIIEFIGKNGIVYRDNNDIILELEYEHALLYFQHVDDLLSFVIGYLKRNICPYENLEETVENAIITYQQLG